jgi:hypothetical protein
MPYIAPKQRKELANRTPTNSGELNYCLTVIILDYFHENGGRYQQINDVLGALEGAKLEFYRRIVVDYEDGKIKEHGDVYK